MKKQILICLLGLLCLPISITTAQVADSPGADFLHRSSPSVPFGLRDSHRGGETRSDTLPEQNGLVDHSVAKGQESESSSASVGAVIYGELINPDSLSPLRLVMTEHKLGYRNTAGESEVLVDLESGKFLDGVMSSVRKKFRLRLPQEGAVYFSLVLGDRVLLEDYILFPSDSVMMSLDLRTMEIVFGGPDRGWMDAQYAVKRGEESDTFYSRRLMEQDREGFLERNNNRAEWEKYKQEFGPRLNIVELGRDGADESFARMINPDFGIIPGWKELQRYKADLSEDQYELLEADLIGNYFGEELRSFLQFQYGVPKMKGQQELLDRMDLMIPELFAKLKTAIDSLTPSTFSVGYNFLITLWVKLERMISGDSFEHISSAHFEGEVLDRLLASNLMYRIRFTPEQMDYWEDYAQSIQSPKWKELAEGSLEIYRTGQPVKTVAFQDLDGKEWNLRDFEGTPTLFYFYFSTCSNSERYFKNYLWPLYKETSGKEKYRLVAVSVDDDPTLWKANIPAYSSSELLNLNLPLAENKEWLEHYHIDAYPRAMLMDPEGKLLSFNLLGSDYADYRNRFIQLLDEADKISTP